MEHFSESNITLYSLTSEFTRLPVYLSTHSNIPSVLIHELTAAWMGIGMILNGFLIYYLVASRKYRSPVFMLVLFLANTDFLVCLSMGCWAGFVSPIYLLPKHTWVLCKIVQYLTGTANSASPYYLVLFAAMRFYQLCFPLHARVRVTSSFVRNWCLLIMFLEILVWSPFLLSFNLVEINYDGIDSISCEYTGNFVELKNMSFLVVNTCIPGISILVLHLMKYIGVAKTNRSVEVQQERKNTDIRALMIVIVMFYIAWFPLNLYVNLYQCLPNHGPYQDHLFLLLLFICGSNNTLNPVVYCLAANSVRNDFVQFICKKKVKKQESIRTHN